MSYSDDLYSSLDEEADTEPIGETLAQDEAQGLGVASQHAWLDTNTAAANAYVDHDVGDGEEDPHLFSPTDGYFGTATNTSSGAVVPASSNVPHVPNVLVEDPSLQPSDAEGKAAEAARERLRNDRGVPNTDRHTSAYPSQTAPPSRNGSSSAGVMTPIQRSTGPSSQSGATYYSPSSSSRIPRGATPTSYTTYSTRGSAYHGDHFHFPPREAPPAYSPSPPAPSNPQRFEGYRTFTQTRDATINMGHAEETQGLLSHPPESMRDHSSDELDEASPTWRGRMRRAQERVNWGTCKIVLIALALLLMTAGFLASIITSTHGGIGHHNPAGDKPQTRPGEPNMSYPDVDGDFTWDPSRLCQDAKIHRHIQTFDVNFGASKQLGVVERTAEDDGRRGWGEVHTQGAVVFRRAGPDTPKSVITIEVAVTDERLRVYSSWDAEPGALQLIVPHRVEWSQDRPRACVNIKVTVWVPENSALKFLNTDVVHLDIKLLDNLSLTVEEGAKLTSIVGTITSASAGADTRDEKLLDTITPPASYHFHSRIIDAHTTAAPITGIWPLYDYLGLQSTSGDIRVAVTPKPADEEQPKPAILYVKSLSGDVDVREPIHAAQATFHIGQQTFTVGSADRARAEAAAEAYLPPREYRTDVHTSSGDISAAVAFSSSAGFKSTSGTISLELLPVLDARQAKRGAREVTLSTATTSGATDVKLLEPLWVEELPAAAAVAAEAGPGKAGKARYVDLRGSPSARSTAGGDGDGDGDGGEKPRKPPPPSPLRSLYSTHTTTSADIKLRYPASWEGDISLATLTGSLQIGGDGVKLIKSGSDWPGVNKSLLARKGEKGEGGKATAKSTSGDVSLWVGGESNAFMAARMLREG